jgi:hypothetical protein
MAVIVQIVVFWAVASYSLVVEHAAFIFNVEICRAEKMVPSPGQ